jgi:hypothetical protein
MSRTYSSRWGSSSGVRLGMTLKELEELNGKPFQFSGIGWDYGGGISGWDGGKLDKASIGITVDADYNSDQQQDLLPVTGDQILNSNDPAVRKVTLRVVAISIYPPVQ